MNKKIYLQCDQEGMLLATAAPAGPDWYVLNIWELRHGSYECTTTKVVYEIPKYYQEITEEEWLLEYM